MPTCSYRRAGTLPSSETSWPTKNSVLGQRQATVIVMENTKEHGLLGNDVLTWSASIKRKNVNSVGCLKNFEAEIKIMDNCRPSYFESRQIPIHLKKDVIEELEKLKKDGIIEEVQQGGSAWASPIVVVKKGNGKIRICGDYKVGVNHKILSDTYPIPNMETAFAEMSGQTLFGKIDLQSAYLQIKLNENSKDITSPQSD